MRIPAGNRRRTVVLVSVLFAFACCTAIQGQNASATSLVGQISVAFSGGTPISDVQLTGMATWHAGSTQDSGPITLNANATGAASMTAEFSAKGTWTESQEQLSAGMACQWSGTDAVAHYGDSMNCLRPIVWFLPDISLQASRLSPGLGISDLGVGPIGPGSYRHLQAQAVLSAIPGKLLASSVQASTTDVGFDANTLLPAVLIYTVHPDNGSAGKVPIEVRYSGYQKVDGVVIPFHIQRYVNGALQLDIQISSVQAS